MMHNFFKHGELCSAIYLSRRECTTYFSLETKDTTYKFENIYFFKVLIFKAAKIANNQGKY